MKTRAAKIIVVLAWLVLGGWFVRYEAFPGYFTNSLEGYKDLFSQGELFVDSWMKILYHDQPIGYSQTQIEVIDDDPLEHYRITSRTSLRMNLMGEMQDVSILSIGGLDMLYHLQRFTFGLSSRRYGLRIEGERRKGDSFMLKIRSDAGHQRAMMEIPDDVILYSPATEMALARLEPGETLRVKTMDPSTMTIQDLVVRAVRKERRDVMGTPQDTTVLAIAMHGVELHSWVDRQGRVVRQETPFGWVMEACTADEALALKVDPKGTDDMLGGLAVRIAGLDRDLRDAQKLRLKLVNIAPERFVLSSARQVVESTTPTSVVLRLSAAAWPRAATILPLPAEARKAYLASSPFVQADDPAIVRRAQDITAGLSNDVEKARAIYDWVYRNVRKQITVSLPSAVDVLNKMEGDCNEHTYLSTALARAAGLPTQMRIGLFYKDGNFYYHAWPSVYLGAWVEMDPTIGQELVDAAHVGLEEGELSNQLSLLELIGRLKAEVLEETTIVADESPRKTP